MKVRLKRTGGIAGIRRQWEIDELILASKKASEWKKLLDKANFFSLPGELGNSERARDAFCYELTVEDKDKKHTVKCTEQNAPKSLCDCLEWIRKNFS